MTSGRYHFPRNPELDSKQGMHYNKSNISQGCWRKFANELQGATQSRPMIPLAPVSRKKKGPPLGQRLQWKSTFSILLQTELLERKKNPEIHTDSHTKFQLYILCDFLFSDLSAPLCNNRKRKGSATEKKKKLWFSNLSRKKNNVKIFILLH